MYMYKTYTNKKKYKTQRPTTGSHERFINRNNNSAASLEDFHNKKEA